jgi:integrase
MRCRQINFVSGTIVLETSKNGEPREAFMTATVRELLAVLVAGKKLDDFVFTKPSNRGRKIQESSQLKDFRKTWATVCVRAEVGGLHCPACDEKIDVTAKGPYHHCGHDWRRCDLTYRGLIFHDLRRCAVRGLMRAGVAQKTAMTITGHKTISVFQRYHIIAPSELKEATRKLETSQEQERELLKAQSRHFGQSLVRVVPKVVQADAVALPIPQPTVVPN